MERIVLADGSKSDNAILCLLGVPTMYTDCYKDKETMEPDLKTVLLLLQVNSRLMVNVWVSALPYPVMKHWEEITGHRLLERYGMTEVTQESFIDGGFFKTGDTVMVDEDGYYIILGPCMFLMLQRVWETNDLSSSDFWSYPKHPSVSECCILGMQDGDYGEVVCAIIVPVEDAKKIPTKLFIWDAIPRNAMGKVNKNELKKLLQN
ncbi:hypothetical protein HPP92_024637 [Vanilla planifolia]|uniref:Uncharacterized protein n=1 Tax=Vanilla planifolia TaxID=51239 RepID=A0A835PK17_VANPL|nr:hypothetical protein HPP92_024637 [Vanilla planifolia]